mgnify:CR=1 FL=1
MFSGIVEEYAEVVRIVKEQENLHLTLKCSFVDELKIDQSISHNGVCLTVVSLQDGTYTVTAMKETIERSNIGLLKVGDKVLVQAGPYKQELPGKIVSIDYYRKEDLPEEMGDIGEILKKIEE